MVPQYSNCQIKNNFAVSIIELNLIGEAVRNGRKLLVNVTKIGLILSCIGDEVWLKVDTNDRGSLRNKR